MNYLSVCSGIEAATVAWHEMGWNPLAFSEIEKFPSQVLAHHYPNTPNLRDMTKFKEWDFGTNRLDLLVGGTPCQSFSIAGLRKGLDDPRGNLALTYVAILDKFRPKWCVWENVPGVLSSGGGRDFASFLTALGQLGYGWSYRVLDAQYFGVAQRRKRVFVVGCSSGWEDSAKVLFESESLSRNTKQSYKKREEVAKCLTTRIRNDYETESFITHCVDTFPTLLSSTAGVSRPGNAVTEHQTYIAYAMQGNLIGRDAGGPNGVGVSDSNTMYTLTKTDVHAIAVGVDTYNASESGDIAVTLTASGNSSTNSDPKVMQNMAVRRLTPVECERLQGFPDEYTNIPKAADGPRYKALGNSMAVPVMKWIGQRIQQVENGLI